jgi:hypothetical protein
MVSSAASTVSQYLAALPANRRAELSRVRDVVNANLPEGYVEGVAYGMICWHVPLSRKPDTYNKQPLCLASLAAQKNHSALYLLSVYGDAALEKKFRAGFAAAGKKLDMGKSCVRFKTADDLALDAVAGAISACDVERLIARHDEVHGSKKSARTKQAATSTPAAKTKSTKARATSKPKARRAR